MKQPCEFCGNEEYERIWKYVDGKPFCTSTCVILWREKQDMDALAAKRKVNGQDLDDLERAANAARRVH